MTSQNPLAYLGIKEKNPPELILERRAPTANDRGFDIGDIWVNETALVSYQLMSVVGGVATWNIITPGVSNVDTINSLAPVLGDIVIAGGTNITDVNGGNTVTLNLDPAITLATSVTAPLFTANAADAVVQAGGANDVVLRLGDAAGATFLRVQNNGSADVFTIDSLGALSTASALTVAGAFAQTAGTFNVGQDNAANAINIGAGNVARAITIGNGVGAHTVSIGSAAAGAIAVDTAAGISLDAATASNFTVTGAAADLTLSGVGGSVNISASEAVNDAIVIEASDAAGGVQIKAGTGGVLIGNEADTTTISVGTVAPTATRNITVAGGTVITAAVTDTLNLGTGGATTNVNSIKTVNVNTGGVTLGQVLTNIASGNVTSGTHTTSIATGNRAAGTMTTDVMTGTGTKTFNLGNADALTTCNIDAVTLINDSVNAATSINTGTSTGAVTIGNALSGAIGVVGGAAVTVDAVGVLELNSSGAAISIGSDADNFNVNVGTAGARTVTVGSGTGASSTVVNSGTGAASFAANATDHTTTIGSTTGVSATVIQSGTGKIDLAGTVQELVADFVDVSGSKITFTQSPILQSNANTGVAPTGATGDVNLLCFQNGIIMEEFVLGAGQTIIAPRMDANGLLVSGDLTAAEGYEYNFGAARANSKHSFTIGTSPAFYLQWRFRVADVSGLEPCYIGFRKTQANDATLANYTDFVAYGPNDGISPGDCAISTQLNTGGLVNTDTNDAFADGSTHTLRINVSDAGVVTFLFDGAPPTATQAYTFDNGDVVHPFFRHTFNAVAPGAINWISMECGNQ